MNKYHNTTNEQGEQPTLRDRFAIQVMDRFLSISKMNKSNGCDIISFEADKCYQIADAMIKERNK